ncbi:hypothetical protein ACOSQ2_022255 [Xanthoceras sorbifolium]
MLKSVHNAIRVVVLAHTLNSIMKCLWHQNLKREDVGIVQNQIQENSYTKTVLNDDIQSPVAYFFEFHDYQLSNKTILFINLDLYMKAVLMMIFSHSIDDDHHYLHFPYY